ncbi:MAG: MMPL family transporter [Deltaproteobacteria bacterium]|jgi:predicted RND superfamily exporter protein|nr:MMPL family transporter [Deltaproteobacteria bacterium]MBW2534979.1 MMPL family transporter [Deltaproteobacteria bacterium]
MSESGRQSGASHRVAGWLLGHPKAVAALLALLAVTSGAFAARLPQEAGLERFLEPTSEPRTELDATRQQFGNEARVFAIYRSDQLFTPEALAEVRTLTQRLSELEGPGGSGTLLFDDVVSLTTVDTLQGSEMSFRTEPLVPTEGALDAAAAAEVGRQARRNPLIAEELLAGDDTATVIAAELPPDADDLYGAFASRTAREAVESLSAEPGFAGEVHVTGQPVVEADVASYQLSDVNRFVPLTYLLVTLILLVLVRRLLGVAVALVSVSLSVVVGLGLLSAVGSSLNSLSTILIPVMMTLSVAVVVHYLTELGQRSRDGDPQQAAHQAMAKLAGPVLLAAITTAVGFGSLSVSTIPALHEFGIAAGAATMASLLVTTLVMALCFRLLPHHRLVSSHTGASSPRVDRALAALSSWVRRRAVAILVVSSAVVALLVAGIVRIEADMNDVETFPEAAPVRIASHVMDQELGGSVSLVFTVEHGEQDHFVSPGATGRIEQFRADLLDDPRVERASSYAEYLKLMHREFFNGDPARYRIPDSAEAAAQLLLLNGDTRLEEYLDPEQRRVRVVARTVEHDTMELAHLFARYQAELEELFPASAGYRVVATGGARIHAEATKTLIESQIRSLTVGGGVILLMVLLVFGSLRLGLLAIPGNLIPVTAALGLLGWFGIRLDAATVMIAVVALGIAVDDTIHFLKRYAELRKGGASADAAIDRALRNKGPAIVGTSVAVGAGMFVTFASNFGPVQNFGWLTAVAMAAAMLGDLIVLPALLSVSTRLDAVRVPLRLKEAMGHAH